jgi:hypothetical protein
MHRRGKQQHDRDRGSASTAAHAELEAGQHHRHCVQHSELVKSGLAEH